MNTRQEILPKDVTAPTYWGDMNRFPWHWNSHLLTTHPCTHIPLFWKQWLECWETGMAQLDIHYLGCLCMCLHRGPLIFLLHSYCLVLQFAIFKAQCITFVSYAVWIPAGVWLLWLKFHVVLFSYSIHIPAYCFKINHYLSCPSKFTVHITLPFLIHCYTDFAVDTRAIWCWMWWK